MKLAAPLLSPRQWRASPRECEVGRRPFIWCVRFPSRRRILCQACDNRSSPFPFWAGETDDRLGRRRFSLALKEIGVFPSEGFIIQR
jgi:hypothetical protein